MVPLSKSGMAQVIAGSNPALSATHKRWEQLEPRWPPVGPGTRPTLVGWDEVLMGKLVYGMLTSLDGFIETSDRKIDWIPIDEELHRFFNEQARACELSLYGRRLYDVMSAWYTWDTNPSATDYELEFARIWQATPKIVFSKSLTEVGPNATLLRDIVPEEILRLKQQSTGYVEVGGAALAAQLIRLGLVDEYRLVVCPVVLGGGTPFFPTLYVPINVRLVERQEFRSGVTYLRYEKADSTNNSDS